MMATISALDRAVEALERLERLANATEPVPDGTLEDALLEVAQRVEDPRLTSPVSGVTALGCWGVFRDDARQDLPWRLTWADKKRPRIEDIDEHMAERKRKQNAIELGFARQSIACRAQEAREWLFRLRAEIEAAHEAVPDRAEGICPEPDRTVSEEPPAGTTRERQLQERESVCCWVDSFLSDTQNLVLWKEIGHRWLTRQLPKNLKVHRKTLKRYIDNDPRLQKRVKERDELVQARRALFDGKDPTEFKDLYSNPE